MKFEIPPMFTQLEKDGRFDYWGAPFRSLTPEEREKIEPVRSLQTLWWRVIEWDDDTSTEAIEGFEADDMLRPGLIPFAGDGSGDRYCWYPAWAEDGEVPVVLVHHDELESSIFARSFEECLVRCLLIEYGDAWDLEDDGGPEVHRERFVAHAGILKPHLSARLAELVARVEATLSKEICVKVERELGKEMGDRSLIGIIPPTKYADEYIKDTERLLGCYQQSIDFFRELVQKEERSGFQGQLDEAIANRDRAATERQAAR